MVPRVGILGLHLEANAFAPPTLEADFRAQCWEEGEAITRQHLTTARPARRLSAVRRQPILAAGLLYAAVPRLLD
jgi:hypothetical protein